MLVGEREYHLTWLVLIRIHLMSRGLGIEMSRQELETAFWDIDSDADGKISRREFIIWTQSGIITDAAERKAASLNRDVEGDDSALLRGLSTSSTLTEPV